MILDLISKTKRRFNANNSKDMKEAKQFFRTYSWKHTGICPFILEYPYLSIPHMLKDKMLEKHLGFSLLETSPLETE